MSSANAMKSVPFSLWEACGAAYEPSVPAVNYTGDQSACRAFVAEAILIRPQNRIRSLQNAMIRPGFARE